MRADSMRTSIAALMATVAATACAEAPPEPATNLRLPLALTRIARPSEDEGFSGRGRADVFVADAEADAVRVLQLSGAADFFLRGPAVYAATGISAPGYPTEVAAAARGTGDRVFAMAPGLSVLHALQVEPAPFQATTVDPGRPPQIRIGTIVLEGPRERFANDAVDPLRRDYIPPVIALRDAFPSLDLEGFTPVDVVVLDEDPVARPEGFDRAPVVDTRVLVAFSRPGDPGAGGRLLVFDVRTAGAGAVATSTTSDRVVDAVDAWFPPDRFVRDVRVTASEPSSERETEVRDLGGVALDVAAGVTVVELDAAVRHLELLFDGSILATDTATSSVVRQYAASGLGAPPALTLTASVAVGGAAHRAVAYGDEGAVVLRADRAALVALDCRAGPCARVDRDFEQLRSFGADQTSLDVPAGVLLTRSPSAVTGAFGRDDADGDPLDLFSLRASVLYRVFPIRGRDLFDDELQGGVLSLVHEDAVTSFVVGAIDDLRVATLDGLFGRGPEDDAGQLVVPEPRVDEVFERRVMLEEGELYPERNGFDVLQPRTRIGGEGCLRPEGFQDELDNVFADDRIDASESPPNPPDDFLGCFPNANDFSRDFVPRQVQNRFQLVQGDTQPGPQQDGCDIEADPVIGDTTYRATYRGALLRAGADVQVDVVEERDGITTLDLEFPTDLDRFDVTEDDVIDLHLRCLTPTEDDPDVFESERTEFTLLEADITDVGRQNLIVRVGVPTSTTASFWAPDPRTNTDELTRVADLIECSGPLSQREGRRELRVFDLEVYPAPDREVAVLTRESEAGAILETFARCPVQSGVVHFDERCARDLPIRFTWEAVEPFDCRLVEGTRVPPSERRDDEREIPADELGRPCTSSGQCGTGRTCVGRAGACPGQCEPLCATSACFAQWRQRVCDGLELRVTGARPVQVDLSASTDGAPGAVIPADSVYAPESRGFIHSFPGARNLRRVRLPAGRSVRQEVID